MQKMSRTSLASLICPSAPFLAPRLLRTTVPMATNLLQTASYATYKPNIRGTRRPIPGADKPVDKPRKRRSSGRREDALSESTDETLRQSLNDVLGQLRKACELRNIHQVMDLYPTLLEAGVLNAYDTRRITQALHVRVRMATDIPKRAELFPFAQKLAADLRSGALAPHHYAYVHLFGIYKECGRFEAGHQLWQWLVDQDGQHVSPAVYGAVIEHMAFGRLMSLEDCENLFQDALKRFPGTFAEYHLRPDAVVSDRTQPTNISGIPMILLQGILTARMLARDWKNSYLALDTALRLYPYQTPPRCFELFMTERPLAEAYTAYMLACRSGTIIRATHVTALLTKIRAAIGFTPSMADRMMLIRAIANALYASVEANGELHGIHLAILIQATTLLLPEHAQGQHLSNEEAPLRDAIVTAVHEIMSGLMQAGMKLDIPPYDALINLAGKLNVPELLKNTLEDLKTSGLEVGSVIKRDIITTAGLLRKPDLIEEYWERIVTTSQTEGSGIVYKDWITLAKACRRADCKDYFWTQLARLPHAIEEDVKPPVMEQIGLQAEPIVKTSPFDYLTIDQLSSELAALKAQTQNIEAVLMSGQPLDIAKNPIQMHLNPSRIPLSSTENLRAVYDQYSTDPHQPPPPPPSDASANPLPRSPTGIPLDELRFQNWVTILEMMDAAEHYEAELALTINTATTAGKPLTTTPELFRIHSAHTDLSYATVMGLRTRVTQLRAAGPVEVKRFRYAVAKSDTSGIDAPMAFDPSKGVWRKRTGRLVKYTSPVQKEGWELEKKPVQVPTLSFYVGLEGSQKKRSRKDLLGIRRVKLGSEEKVTGGSREVGLGKEGERSAAETGASST